MLRDLKKTSINDIKTVFSPLDEFPDYVCWIRNHDLSKQYYQSLSCNTIWQSDMDVVYDLPMVWLDYLVKDDGLNSLRQLSARHENDYLNPVINRVCYQIVANSGELRYLVDQAYRCYSTLGDHYIVGISKNVGVNDWHKQYGDTSKNLLHQDESVYKLFFRILEQEFSIVAFDTEIVKSLTDCNTIIEINKLQNFKLSNRELECLQLFCEGKSYKEAAKILAISPRTIETHLVNIMNKTSCNNKTDVICRFSRYFSAA